MVVTVTVPVLDREDEVFEETDRVIEPLPVPEDLLAVSHDALLETVQLAFDVIVKEDDVCASAVGAQLEVLTDNTGLKAAWVTETVLVSLNVGFVIVMIALRVETALLAAAVKESDVVPLGPEALSKVSQEALLEAVQLMFDVRFIDVVPPSAVGFHVSADEVREAAICDIVIILGVV